MPTPIYNSEDEKRRLREESATSNRPQDGGMEIPEGNYATAETPATEAIPATEATAAAETAPAAQGGLTFPRSKTNGFGEPVGQSFHAPLEATNTATEEEAEEATDGYEGHRKRIQTLQDIVDSIEQERAKLHVESEEQRLAREKREAARKALASVFDFASAVGNLEHTTRYAPSQDLGNGLSGRYKELYEQAAKEREKKRALWDNYNAQLRKAKAAKAGAEAALDDAKREDAQAAAALAAKAAADDKKLKADADKYKDKRAGEEADRAERKRHNKAMEAAARARAAATARSRNSGRVTEDMHYVLPDGTDIVIPADKFRTGTLAEAFRGIEDDNKPVAGRDLNNRPYTPSLENMDYWIGSNLDNDDVVDALYRLEGKGRRRTHKEDVGYTPNQPLVDRYGMPVYYGQPGGTAGGKTGGGGGSLLPQSGGSKKGTLLPN